MRILIIAGGTGGHVYPAFTIAKKFCDHGHDIAWIGKENSLEEKLAVKEGFNFSSISAKGFLGKNLLGKLVSIFLLGTSLIKGYVLILKLKPDLVFSTGGYLSLGPSVSAFFYCPLFIHEQNSVPGLTNKILHRISKNTFEAFPNTFKTHRKKVFTVGNPIRAEIAEIPNTKERIDSRFRVLVIGGSQGSQQINDIMIKALRGKDISSKWFFTHQVGKLESKELRKAYDETGASFVIKDFIDDMSEVYRNSDIVISRSGAMSVSEICSAQKPSILLPLPWSADNHQLYNAKFLSERGAAIVLESNISSAQAIYQLLIELEKDHNRREAMKRAAGMVFPKSTSDTIYNKIHESLQL